LKVVSNKENFKRLSSKRFQLEFRTIQHAHRTEPVEPPWKLPESTTFLKKMIHEQLPLPVPCYDLAPLTESSLGPLARNFGYPQLAWLDGRWVQDSGTYSSPRSWLAITSDSSFMRSGFRPQSELRPVLVRLISSFRYRSALSSSQLSRAVPCDI